MAIIHHFWKLDEKSFPECFYTDMAEWTNEQTVAFIIIDPNLISVLVHLSLSSEGIPLLVIQVFLEIEECIEKYRSHFTPL